MIKFISPYFFNKYLRFIIPLLLILLICTITTGLYYALLSSPPDYQQGEIVRIMYIHVPAAWMSLGIYSFIAVCSFIVLVYKVKMFYILAIAAAPVGAGFALITLVTGSIWGKPIWGTWWVWDARLTSTAVLFLLYISYINIVAGNNIIRAERPASVMALIGFINVPIVKFSVDIWYSLHQPSSIMKATGPSIYITMLVPLLIMFSSYIIYFLLLLTLRTNTLLWQLKKFRRN